MRKIVVAIFLVLTFLYSCSGLNNTIQLKQDKAIGLKQNDTIKLKPDDAIAHSNKGIAYAKLGQYKLAFEDYNQAIRLKPDYADAYYNWGYAYDKLNQYQLAIDYYNQAIRLNPNYARAYINRGVAYLSRCNKKLGCPDAQKACALGNCKLLEMAKGKGDCR